MRMLIWRIYGLCFWLSFGCVSSYGREPQTANAAPKSEDRLWSLRPLVRPAFPENPDHSAELGNPVDLFIRSKLKELGLTPSSRADRRTLIRRLYFDLIGLPPRPEEVERFLNDPDPMAYERLVEHLLASPHYGERWARHWLDVVHFGETHGYDKDKQRTHAWPYRDYVIRAFNQDKPYWRFVQEQIAGDVLFPFTRDGIEALGFIAAGPWDLIGHEEVPETKIDGKIARHLDRDDVVMNTIQTFNSLTVHCAQCHHHKFDPIPQEDYYRLQAVFAALDRTNVKYDADPEVAAKRKSLKEKKGALEAKEKALNASIRERAGEALLVLEHQITESEEKGRQIKEAFGYHSPIAPGQETTKWVQIDLGQEVIIRSIKLHPCKEDFNNIGEGFGFPLRFKIEAATDKQFQTPVSIAEETTTDFPNPKLKAVEFQGSNAKARFVRITASRLAPRKDDYIFALAEVQVLTPEGTNVARGAMVTALDSIEAPVRWQKQNLTDGYWPGGPLVESVETVQLKKNRENLLASHTPAEVAQELEKLASEKEQIDTALAELPPQLTVYAGGIHHGSGNFRGTGPDGGKPRPVFLLNRGNIQAPVREVEPGTLSCVEGLSSRFELPAEAPEGERRAALARWITDPRNPLTWRSIVNRVWQYHFGRGLVDTPNDFGNMGEKPTHPELLDWLALEFRDGGQSLKKLHKLIVTSETYRQVSRDDPARSAVDAENRYLWRMTRRKLEAEAVRDSILFVAGKLDPRMGGPSFQDFVIEKPEHSPHYRYQLHDPSDPKTHRRSIYRFLVRSQPQPFMSALDCADPSMQVAKRNESLTALQALALLNNKLVLAMSTAMAEQAQSDPRVTSEKIRDLFYRALSRPPSETETEKLMAYAAQYGLANTCRVLFNLNEFSFVD